MSRLASASGAAVASAWVDFVAKWLDGRLQCDRYEPLSQTEKDAILSRAMADGRDLKALTQDESRTYFLALVSAVRTEME